MARPRPATRVLPLRAILVAGRGDHPGDGYPARARTIGRTDAIGGVKYGAWEVEKAAMDVQADDAGLEADPSATAVFERPRSDGQGQLFPDARPTQPTRTPTRSRPSERPRADHRPRAPRALRLAVVLVALAVLAAGAALGLVKAGVIGSTNGGSGTATPRPPARHHSTVVTVPKNPLLTASSSGQGAGTATYTVAVPAYTVTVVTTTGRSWVSIGIVGQHPIFEGILAPASSQREILLGNSQVDVGAGGTKVIVTSDHRSVTLTPPSAPFSYQFSPKS